MDPLRLAITDYQDETRWRWCLSDGSGRFLADHEVRLDPSAREYRGLLDLNRFLDYYTPAYPPAEQLKDLGAWIGAAVFGGLRDALQAQAQPPALPMRVEVPTAARALLQYPLDLARLGGREGPTLGDLGLTLIYCPEGLPDGQRAKSPATEALRILACFSLPDNANPLNLRRERYQLRCLVRDLGQTRGRAIQLRVIQYGATRDTLKDALQEAPGWDLIHLSGHGGQGELLLETPKGGLDRIGAADLAPLLAPARGRVKLLILDACYSGAASHRAARAQLGLELDPAREGAAGDAATPTSLPSLAEDLARALDCAALAMRYPVGDGFATDLSLALYGQLLGHRQPLPAALRLALAQALADDPAADLPLSPFTPVLLGPRAAALTLIPPARPVGGFVLPQTGLFGFPPEPARFVGRVGPMLRASLALARESTYRCIFFYGMAGAGKTACALELAYRHEQDRFEAQVWYKGPEEGAEISTALYDLMLEIERQLNAPNLGLALHVDEPERFKGFVLPRLRGLLEQHALLLVLDNLEHLLSASGAWRDPLWGALMETLIGQRGRSRTILTSRRLPDGLDGATGSDALAHGVLCEPIHALSLAESVLLARELPNLRGLFADAAGRDLLTRTLRIIQGHPELLRLADGQASDRAALAAQVAATETGAAAGPQGAVLDAFFAVTGRGGEGEGQGESRQPEDAFVATLHRWTRDLSAGLDPGVRLLLQFLCRVEAPDRTLDALESTWGDLRQRLGDQDPAAAAALARPGLGLTDGLADLQRLGLLDTQQQALDPDARAALTEKLTGLALPDGLDPDTLLAQALGGATHYRIHPGVAEAVRAETPLAVLDAADLELGDYHLARYRHGRKTEGQGGGGLVVDGCRRGAPYLIRSGRWQEATHLLAQMTRRDQSPETLAFAIPLLRRIGEATAGTERGLIDANVLATTLWMAGRPAEAEAGHRRVIAGAAAAGQFRTASAAAGDLLNLLLAGGRLPEALALAGETAGYTRAAGLGPWTQLADEVRRLQVFAAMGRSDEVLREVETLRLRMAALPGPGGADETVQPWNVREAILDTGRDAARLTERWQQALDLNAEIANWKSARGAGDLELARTRFNDYFPLLRLDRRDDCRGLLQQCRAVFERERSVEGLGMVYSALADLEDQTGDPAGAVGFERAALRFSYQAGDPESCAISHHNLSIYLKRQGADPAQVLAHGLADSVLCIQMGSGGLQQTIRNLANLDLPDHPPPFTALADLAEQVPGVHLSALLAALPATYPDPDAALAAVWALVREARGQPPPPVG